MNLIVFSRHGQSRHYDLAHPLVWGGLALLFALLTSAIFYGGYYTAARQAEARAAADPLQRELAAQADEITNAKRVAQADVDALSGKVGELQAHVIRLDALGAQLTSMAGLKRGEFNFNAPPAEGGPDIAAPPTHAALPDFMT